MTRAAAILVAVLLSLLAPAPLHARDSQGESVRIHTVYSGQRLGSIAKRYNVSVAALCHANDLDRRDPIFPGQRLIVPARDDEDGSAARALRKARLLDDRAENESDRPARGKAKRSPRKLRVHTVYRGQRLGSIAKRYNVTVDALCQANRIRRTDAIFPGQKLVVPSPGDHDGSEARRLARTLEKEEPTAARGGPSWRPYEKPPWRRGYVRLIGHHERWTGYVIGPGNEVLSGARRAISRVLTAPSNRRLVNARLVRVIARVSDTFGGRPLRVVSGYRTTSYVRGSRHKVGRAVDFRIPGVPNSVLRDYLRTLENVGVGYYPNSTFVHLDVRERAAYWVDLSGPGEAPRYRRAAHGPERAEDDG